METEKRLTIDSPLLLSTDSTVGPTYTKPIHCPKIYHLAYGRRTKRSRGFDQRSVGMSDRSVVRSEIVDADRAVSSKRSWALPVGSKASFPFHSSASEVREKWLVNTCTLGIRFRQTPKVLRVRSSFGRAGEPAMAIAQMGWKNRSSPK